MTRTAGAAIGAGAIAVLLAAALGTKLHTSLGSVVDAALGLVLLAGGVALAGFILYAGARLLGGRPSPPLLVLGGLGAVAALVYVPVLLPLVGAGALCGAAVAHARERAPLPAALPVLAAGLALVGVVAWLASAGSAAHRRAPPAAPLSPTSATLADADAAGPFAVRELAYGEGGDRHRAEFGRGAALRTRPVDLSARLHEWSALDGLVRTRYWGFDSRALPLNGLVWYPAGDGPFPLVLLVHGNFDMTTPSHRGLAYLGRHLASHGFVAVAIDESFLNLSFWRSFNEEVPARAWLILEHLRLWREWTSTIGNPFANKVDLARVAVVGHSRGGQAAALAAAYGRPWRDPEDGAHAVPTSISIGAVVALAPTDATLRSERPTTLVDTDYLVIQGGQDCDVSAFAGLRQYERSDVHTGLHFKSAIYVPRAGHAAFNSEWGARDNDDLSGWLENRAPRMSASAQRRLAQRLVTAFLEASLKQRFAYRALFRAPEGTRADAAYVSRYADSSLRMVADFEEDADITHSSSGGEITARGFDRWRERSLVLRDDHRSKQGNTAVELCTAGESTYRLLLPFAAAGAAGDDSLRFSLALLDGDPLRCAPEIELETRGRPARVALHELGPLVPSLPAVLSKAAWLEDFGARAAAEELLVDYELPLRRFAAADTAFDPRAISSITFRFTTAGCSLLLDAVGFASDGGAPL